jgi:hypothetical protein
MFRRFFNGSHTGHTKRTVNGDLVLFIIPATDQNRTGASPNEGTMSSVPGKKARGNTPDSAMMAHSATTGMNGTIERTTG